MNNLIRLEKFTEADFDRFISWIDNEKFMYQFAGPYFTFPITREQLTHYINNNSRRSYRVIEVDSKRIIGHGEMDTIDLRNKNARLCRILVSDKADRNKGYGRQIINGLLEIGFGDLGLHRIDLGVFDFNKSAIKCYENCGFKIEGLLRDKFVIGKEFYSVYNMSILRHEWIIKNEALRIV
jgi:RimJ/RimL family protein N-acetyltransferase